MVTTCLFLVEIAFKNLSDVLDNMKDYKKLPGLCRDSTNQILDKKKK